MKKMKVEIWSDITCTHCYSAKRKLEKALKNFDQRDYIEITWKSFELAPALKTDPDKLLPQFLTELLGISMERSMELIEQVSGLAKQSGLYYNLMKTIPANSVKAHRLSHLAKTNNLQDKAEEILFRSYFTDGKNIDDELTLIRLGEEIGIETSVVKEMFAGNQFLPEVQQDMEDARQMGITSVPHIIFGGLTAISGEQDSAVFLKTLEKTFGEWQHANGKINLKDSCEIGGNC